MHTSTSTVLVPASAYRMLVLHTNFESCPPWTSCKVPGPIFQFALQIALLTASYAAAVLRPERPRFLVFSKLAPPQFLLNIPIILDILVALAPGRTTSMHTFTYTL